MIEHVTAIAGAAVIGMIILAMAAYSAGFAHGKESGILEGEARADDAARREADERLRRSIDILARQVADLFQKHKDELT